MGVGSGSSYTFTIAASLPYPYDWIIDWGDNSPLQRVFGIGCVANPALSHTYPGGVLFFITIRPSVSPIAWFRAFGGDGMFTIRTLNSPLTVAMFAEPNATVLGDNVC